MLTFAVVSHVPLTLGGEILSVPEDLKAAIVCIILRLDNVFQLLINTMLNFTINFPRMDECNVYCLKKRQHLLQ